jgi:hypothetical protein
MTFQTPSDPRPLQAFSAVAINVGKAEWRYSTDKIGVSHASNRFAQAGSFGYICDSLQEVLPSAIFGRPFGEESLKKSNNSQAPTPTRKPEMSPYRIRILIFGSVAPMFMKLDPKIHGCRPTPG